MDQYKYIGRLLDNRYEILEVIGTGGMAVVYKARCHRLNRLVAIKILKDEYSQDEEFRRRFHAEGQAVAMLSHPNIVQVYDVSSTDNADYIVMELIDGITMKQYMEKKGVLNWKETLHFSMLIAKALEHAHSRQIVHRDIKPHNVMVLKDGSVKVTDFGIARIMSKSNTLTKEALGSVHYISPEQAKGARVDNRSDLYSLGVVMYEMMTGRAPYDGDSPVAVAIQHINGGAPMPSTLNPNIPGGLEQIIMKTMSVEPSDRYVSATALLYDMDELRKNPNMLFAYGMSLGDTTKVGSGAAVAHTASQQRRTSAERAAGENARRQQAAAAAAAALASSKPGQTARRTQAEASRREESSRTATMAIVALSVVAVIALAIFLLLLVNGGLLGRSQDLVQVPSLIGEYYEDVKNDENFEIVLQSSRYDEMVAEGIILEQTPSEGMKERGIRIYVVVSLGPTPEEILMQDLSNGEGPQVEQLLTDQGYHVKLRSETSDDIPAGNVIRTEPAAGEPVTPGQVVVLVISTGPELVTANMPNVVGMTLENAVGVLKTNGFENYEVEEVDSDAPEGEVVNQSEVKNTQVDVTTVIVLQISNGLKKVPNVVGLDRASAVDLLTQCGLNNVKIEQVESDAPEGEVISQSVDAETSVSADTQIVLEVSKGMDEQLKTIQYTLRLPTGMTEAYSICLKQGDVEILEEIVITDLTLTELVVELTGMNIQKYQLYVNGEKYGDPIYVEFNV